MRGLMPRACVILSGLLLVVRVAALEIPYKHLESNKLLVKPTEDGRLLVAGYAVPPRIAPDLPRLPDIDVPVVSADGALISTLDINTVLDAVNRGDLDSALLPILYDVDGVTSGKELAGFIKLQFIQPKLVKFQDSEDEESEKGKKTNLNSRTVIIMKEPLGVTCAVVDGKAEVATIAPESPVKAAGVSVRDLLTHVNGFSLSQRTPEDAIQVMLSTEFPKSVTFLRNENSIIDYTNEDVEGEFVVTSPDIVAGLTVKYKRALFGGLSSCTPYRVVTASPEEGCQLLRTPLPTGESEYDTNIAVMAERGLCKFEDKATVAGLAGGTAVFVSNNKEEPNLIRMPGSRPDLKIPQPALMISYADGKFFQATKALNVPVIVRKNTRDCFNGSTPLVPAQLKPKLPPKSRRYSADDTKNLGVVFVHNGNTSEPMKTYEFLVAKYGPSLGDKVALAKLVLADPEDGCVPQGALLGNAPQISGNVAVIKRGKCPFPDKTLVAQLSKAIAVIIVNTDKNLLRLPAPPDLDPKSVRIPTVLVSPVFMDAMPKHIFETPPLGRMIMHES